MFNDTTSTTTSEAEYTLSYDKKSKEYSYSRATWTNQEYRIPKNEFEDNDYQVSWYDVAPQSYTLQIDNEDSLHYHYHVYQSVTVNNHETIFTGYKKK